LEVKENSSASKTMKSMRAAFTSASKVAMEFIINKLSNGTKYEYRGHWKNDMKHGFGQLI
jgi:hypothetical protein